MLGILFLPFEKSRLCCEPSTLPPALASRFLLLSPLFLLSQRNIISLGGLSLADSAIRGTLSLVSFSLNLFAFLGYYLSPLIIFDFLLLKLSQVIIFVPL